MGTCLAVIKVIGITSLGLFTGQIATNVLSTNQILKFVLIKNSNPLNLNQINEFIKTNITQNGIISTTLGLISTLAFQLAYFGAPSKAKHPYLIYSSLVFPISSLLYFVINKDDLAKFFRLNNTLPFNKTQTVKPGKKKQVVKSELDNSIYKDLGETSSVDEEEEIRSDDEEIENEVEYHLNQQTTNKLLESLQFTGKFISGLSVLGFIIAGVGLYGDNY